MKNKYIVKLTHKRKIQINTIVLSSNNANDRAIELFKNLYRLTNDKRQFWEYEII